ncbi:MAG: hypothetical protein KGS72_26190 [Cyanobacteria bacterium REEB67]|nr:hypothetical protein [Cyanobacteria bacterium REEB67]
MAAGFAGAVLLVLLVVSVAGAGFVGPGVGAPVLTGGAPVVVVLVVLLVVSVAVVSLLLSASTAGQGHRGSNTATIAIGKDVAITAVMDGGLNFVSIKDPGNTIMCSSAVVAINFEFYHLTVGARPPLARHLH